MATISVTYSNEELHQILKMSTTDTVTFEADEISIAAADALAADVFHALYVIPATTFEPVGSALIRAANKHIPLIKADIAATPETPEG